MQDYDNKRTECLEKDVEISQLRNEVLMLTTQPMANPVSFDKEIQVSAVYLDKGVQTSRVSIPANKKDKRVEPISRISSGDNSENDEFRPSFEHYFTRIVRSYTDKTVRSSYDNQSIISFYLLPKRVHFYGKISEI